MFVAGTSTHKVGEVAQTLLGVAPSAHAMRNELYLPRIAQRAYGRANPDLVSESHTEPDGESAREGRTSREKRP